MHVAVIGRGALGSVYGARLALRARAGVTWVVRPKRVAEAAPIVIERVRGDRREEVATPRLAARVPEDADVVLLTVPTNDLEGIASLLAGVSAPVVLLTPMLPGEWQKVRAALGERAFAAMANIAAYVREDGVTRYWHLPSPLRIDEPRRGSPHAHVVRELARALRDAGFRASLDLGVHERNPATTVSYIALGMAFAIAGSADALAADTALLELVYRACREGSDLGARLGAREPIATLTPILSSPLALRVGLAALRRLSPEGLRYAEAHFGVKLIAQNRLMIREMIALAKEKGTGHEALEEVERRLLRA